MGEAARVKIAQGRSSPSTPYLLRWCVPSGWFGLGKYVFPMPQPGLLSGITLCVRLMR